MNKILKPKTSEYIFPGIIIFSTCILFYILKWFLNPTELQYSSQLIHEKISKDVQILESYDTHGGFLGDGQRYTVYQFDQESYKIFVKKIQKNTKWKSLPFKQNESFLGEIYNQGNIYKIPKNSENGFYYFKNRYNSDEGKFLKKYLFNYTFALLDLETMRLYILEQDT